MWLLPVFALISAIAARVYYRLTIAGDTVPKTGPVLLVANHPNSLLDPMLVAAAAGRPVRFLAKAPLFKDKKVGWLVKASGAIPIFRRVDDPNAMNQNADMFRAVVEALSNSAAVGIFPEGVSHSEPALTNLKTGAARIALATAKAGTLVRIAPIGIVLRNKDRFRSDANVLVGPPVKWADLVMSDPEDRDAVAKLTNRIGDALRGVTLNLEAWADEPMVECTEAIWSAEHGGDNNIVSKVARMRVTTELLAKFRHEASDQTTSVAQAIETHFRRLQRLRLTPGDLKVATGARVNVAWIARRFYLVGVPATVLGLVGGAAFWIPFQITTRLSKMANLPVDQRSTFNLLVGTVVYGVWVAAMAVLAWRIFSPITGLATLLLLPILGMIGMQVRERWRGAWQDVRKYMTRRSRRELIQALAERQRQLAAQLLQLYQSSVR